MNREAIEKAAEGKAEELRMSANSVRTDIDVQNIFQIGFIDGAYWRINSVCHSTDELPKYSGFLAVLMRNGLMETMYYSAGIGFHEMTLKGYTSWAYVSDLLPERKEG